MTILFAAGCAGQNNTTYSLKGEQPLAEEDTSGGADSTARNTDSDTVLVHICGEVRTPGVYELTADCRICDVLLLAGGFTAGGDTEGHRK